MAGYGNMKEIRGRKWLNRPMKASHPIHLMKMTIEHGANSYSMAEASPRALKPYCNGENIQPFERRETEQ